MIRKPFINEATTEMRVVRLIKELNRIVDDLNRELEKKEDKENTNGQNT